jgi:hypothetical protein
VTDGKEPIMILRTHSDHATNELVITLIADFDVDSATHAVGAGGGWQIDTWRDDLTQTLMDGQTMFAVGMRTALIDRILADQTWTDIAHRLARHPGVLDGDQPWVAIRIGEGSIRLFAPGDRPPSIPTLDDFGRDIEERYGLTPPRTAGQAFPKPGKTDAQPSEPPSPAPPATERGKSPRR